MSPVDFPPVFHIKLRDHVLLEGDPITLSCLPAGSPHPHIHWMKGQPSSHAMLTTERILLPVLLEITYWTYLYGCYCEWILEYKSVVLFGK